MNFWTCCNDDSKEEHVPNAQWPQPRSSVAQRENVSNNLQPSISGASFHGEHEYGVMSIKNNHTRRNFVLLVTLGASNSENSTEPVDLSDINERHVASQAKAC
uniref:Uncharacterized protein n=1 Tax=Knipowitschia caucasica TaxID=637954 RepID=A0AAV2KCT9_KNICA